MNIHQAIKKAAGNKEFRIRRAEWRLGYFIAIGSDNRLCSANGAAVTFTEKDLISTDWDVFEQAQEKLESGIVYQSFGNYDHDYTIINGKYYKIIPINEEEMTRAKVLIPKVE